MGKLEKKVVIVTGGARGIGLAIARRFAAEGANVVAAARTEPVASFDPNCGIAFRRTDVADSADVEGLVRFAVERWGGLDVLVNNAGVQLEKTIEDTTEQEWDTLMDINLKGVFLCSKQAVPHLRARGGGVIINIGSYDGFQADPGLAAYCASKGGVHALSRAIAVDHGKDRIRCNVICPGWIKTEMMDAYLSSQSGNGADAEQQAIDQHLLGRLGQPSDIASMALWLASDEAGFTTGQLFVIDGGLTAHAPFVG